MAAAVAATVQRLIHPAGVAVAAVPAEVGAQTLAEAPPSKDVVEQAKP